MHIWGPRAKNTPQKTDGWVLNGTTFFPGFEEEKTTASSIQEVESIRKLKNTADPQI